jgi:hypothetical protein
MKASQWGFIFPKHKKEPRGETKEAMRTLKLMCSCLAIAAFVTVAALQASAQETNPMPALSDYGLAAQGPATDSSTAAPESPTSPPGYCNPCRYYSGNFDALGPNPDALANENDRVVSMAQLYTPFLIPSGHQWTVTGLFINSMAAVNDLKPKKAGWSLWRNVSAGTAGTLVAAGAAAATMTATGRSSFGLTEYTIKVTLSTPVTLPCGVYWLNILPQCTNAADANCGGQRYFETDVEDASPARHFGPANILGNSFFNSNFFGADYVAATTEGSGGFDLFSFGVIGATAAGPICL